MTNWLFKSKQHLEMVLMAAVALTITLFLLFMVNALSKVPDAPVGSTAAPEPASTGLLAPSPEQEAPPATTDYGSSIPVALEAVSAFLTGDRPKFASLAQPDAVELVNEAPVPHGSITASASTVLPGPTQQKINVPTTDGDLLLDMIIVDGSWKVLNIEDAK